MRFKLLLIALMLFALINLVNGAGCCTETKTGEFCKDVDSGLLCNSGYNDGVSCSQTSACVGGCCDLTQEGGSCSNGMIEYRCNSLGGNWDSNPQCLGVESCESVCCEIGGNRYWTSSGDCNNRNGDVDTSIGNEIQCVSSNEEGCCADSCRYGYGGGCSEGWFFADTSCSNVAKCKEEITSHASQGCGDTLDTKNDVYWFDSKGNKEELIKDCSPPSTSCGEKDGGYDCLNLDCLSTWDNPNVDGDGGLRKNGESWCEYQSAVGPGLDLPGTSHYLHSCINGKEAVEICATDRSKICIWDDISGKSQAACVDNNWKKCFDCKTNSCCEDPGNLCLWIDKEAYKRCVPIVPPGNILDPGDDLNDGRGKYCANSVGDNLGEINYLCNMHGECGADYNLNGEFKNKNLNILQSAYLPFSKDAGKGLYRINENKNNLFAYEGLGVQYSVCVGECDASDRYKNDYSNCVIDRTAYCNTLPEYSNEAIYKEFNDCTVYSVPSQNIGVCGKPRAGCLKQLTMYCAAKDENNLCNVECGGTGIAQPTTNIFGILTSSPVMKQQPRACGIWDPGYNTDSCDKCRKGELLPDYNFNGEGYICTEELCTSLGSCEWLDDTIEGSACISKDISDVSKPVISVDYDNFKYDCNKEAPGDITDCKDDINQGLEVSNEPKGVSIKGELVDSYEGNSKNKGDINVAIAVDKYSKCKYSLDLNDMFDDMDYSFSNGKLGLNHEINFINKIGDMDLRDGKEYNIYIRCGGYNGIESDSFFVKFKKAEQPDLSPAVIYRLTFDPETDSYVLYGKETEIVSFDLNEDAECRWSKDADVNFENIKNKMNCIDDICAGDLNVSVGENRYYFRCKDAFNNINTQDQPYDGYILHGSASNLSIDSVSCIQRLPDGSMVDKCDEILVKNFTLKAVTSGGAKNGDAKCSYNGNIFFKTNGKDHEQCIGCGGEQYLLQEGSYQYKIDCIDVAENQADYELNSFLRIDYKAPRIERYYVKDSMLKVETDEPSYCRYTNSLTINYNTATEMASADKLIHSASASKDFFKVQCKDRFGNSMSPVNIYLAYI